LINEEWYKPQAIVTGLGEEDWNFYIENYQKNYSIPINTGGFDANSPAYHPRLNYFCQKNEFVSSITSKFTDQKGHIYEGNIIFKKLSINPPQFLKNIAKNEIEALRQFKKADYQLEERRSENTEHVDSIKLNYNSDKNYLPENDLKLREDLEDQKLKLCKELREKILFQNQNEWIEVDSIKIPKKPFVAWSLFLNANYDHPKYKEWNIICPESLKLYEDIPLHSDWMVGAGLFDFESLWYNNEEFRNKIYNKVKNIQIEILGYSFILLSGNKSASGFIVFPNKNERIKPNQIAVICSADPEYLEAALSGAGLIVENGGALCHLANVCRESNITVVRAENATELFKLGDRVCLDIEQKKIIMIGPGVDAVA
jgi:phosphohistidine swiveling domain-containing protein